MMNAQTVDQVLETLTLFWQSHAKGTPLHRAYRTAVRNVADRYKVAYQTIGDATRRRLNLDKIEDLYDLLERWTEGESAPIEMQLKSVSDPLTHQDIASFFGHQSNSSGTNLPTIDTGKHSEHLHNLEIILPESDMRALRALAELRNVTPEQALRDLVGPAASEAIRSMLR